MSGEDSILDTMHKISEDTPGYCPRPKEDQYLRLWDSEDLERLGLKSLQTNDGYTKTHTRVENELEEQQEEENPLEQIKRN